MPCHSEYLAANDREVESRTVCKLLVYALGACGEEVPIKVLKVSAEYYGDPDNLDEYVDQLCTLCRKMPAKVKNKVMYDGRKKAARELADWWENHQKVDADRSRKKGKK